MPSSELLTVKERRLGERGVVYAPVGNDHQALIARLMRMLDDERALCAYFRGRAAAAEARRRLRA